MTNRTARGIFSTVYCLPGLYAVARSVLRPTSPEEARVLLCLAFGGLALLIVACSALLPALLLRLGQADRADRARRAAFSAIPFGTTWTFLWTMLFVPSGAPALRFAVGLTGVVASLTVLWWVDRRWLHLDLFRRT